MRRFRPVLLAATLTPALASTLASALASALALAALPASARPFTPKDLAMLDRVSDPRLSPDGKRVVFDLRSTDWAANKGTHALWMVCAASARIRRRSSCWHRARTRPGRRMERRCISCRPAPARPRYGGRR